MNAPTEPTTTAGITDVMLDLETMGTDPNSAIVAIVAIGAQAFSLETHQLGPSFYVRVNLASNQTAGRSIDADTVLWWLSQSDEARAELTRTPQSCADVREELEDALMALNAWLRQSGANPDCLRMWGNGSDFDCVILRQAYKSVAVEAPWRWYNNRCLRTALAMLPKMPKRPFEGTPHHALHDAHHQAQRLIDAHQAAHNPAPAIDVTHLHSTDAEFVVHHTHDSLMNAALDLVREASHSGLVLTIEQTPLKPLAMGNYAHRVSVRKAKGVANG